jgi:hypothetical protein
MKTQDQHQEKWRAEQREFARATKEGKRRILKRQWARQQRATLKGTQSVMMYFPAELLSRVEESRPKGMGRSKIIVELIKLGLSLCEEEKKRQLAERAGKPGNVELN